MRFGLFGLIFPDCVPQTGEAPDGPTYEAELTRLEVACDEEGWSYDFTVDGDSSGVQLDIYGGNWDENHGIPEGTEADGQVVYSLDLLTVYSADAWVSGESTLFSCPSSGGFDLNWKVEVVDDDGNLAECWVFGSAPEGLGFEDCQVWPLEEQAG